MNNQRTYYRRNMPHYQPPHGKFHVVFRLEGSLPYETVERLKREREEREEYLASEPDVRKRHDLFIEFQEQYFEKFDALLDGAATGPRWLEESAIAAIVAGALRKRDGIDYDLIAFTIMSNHVHAVLDLEAVARNVSRSAEGQEHRVEARPAVVVRDSSRRVKNRAELQTAATREEAPVTRICRLIKGSTAYKCNRLLKRSGQFWQHESYDHLIRNDEELERTIWYVLNNPVKASLARTWEDWKWTYVKPQLVSSG